ncbi:hypothetical protein KDL01_00060 [Actinospica durhamensis]|uniref:Uncharacterized protein n=1 Tax=Actinospica durhamensis TaxID=1508375 RepID=A0A941IKA5_9ACTN|nr:hypothetical protein [Actinospica durhamensis]MBR7831630.1 hypothetical protein [Actinospica durhamensis]
MQRHDAPERAAAAPHAGVGHLLKNLWIPLYMALAMSLAYIGGFHQAEPHHIPVAVVATSSSERALAQKIQAAAGDALDVRTVAGSAQGQAEVASGQVSGSFSLSATGADPRLVIDTAASPTTAQAVTTAFDQVAAQQDVRLDVVDLGPLPSYDSLGQNVFFLLVAVTVGSYTLAATLGAAGAGVRPWRRAGIGVLGAGVISAIAVAVADPLIGAVRGHAWELFGMSWLYAAAVVLIGAGLHTFLKKANTPALVTIFVALNFTTSGGVFAPILQAGFFRALSHVWIGAGYVSGGQSMLYRGGAGFGADLLRIALWFAAGVVVMGAAAVTEHRRSRPAAPVCATEEELEVEQEQELEAIAA